MTITTDQLTQFRALLKNEEKSAATLNKYLRDIQRFALWLGDTPLERDAMLDYKADLMRHYAAGSVNSILAALNRFLRMIAREDCRVHRLRIQYQAYSPEEREITAQEYADLVRTARETGRARLALVLQTICATGIRVSELVGIDLEDLDFTMNGFLVTRKGGNQTILYFPESVADALKAYLQERMAIEPLPGHEKALFLSMQRRRITQRAVENLVKKYASLAAPLKKKISPHKLRSTFGTSLYRETGDIYLVADVLGHADVNTTRRHYAAMLDERRRMAAQQIKVRENEPEPPQPLPIPESGEKNEGSE